MRDPRRAVVAPGPQLRATTKLSLLRISTFAHRRPRQGAFLPDTIGLNCQSQLVQPCGGRHEAASICELEHQAQHLREFAKGAENGRPANGSFADGPLTIAESVSVLDVHLGQGVTGRAHENVNRRSSGDAVSIVSVAGVK